MKRLAILGASGHGKVVAEAALLSGWESVSFFDDAYPEKKQLSSWSVYGTTSDLIKNSNNFDGVHIAIGHNLIRHNKFDELAGLNIVSIIHPSAVISSSAAIGHGAVILWWASGHYWSHFTIVNIRRSDTKCVIHAPFPNYPL